jgi:thymidylate kinase
MAAPFPRYVALEGVKGAGKSTLYCALARHLFQRGVAFVELCPTRAMPAWHPLEWLTGAGLAERWDALTERLYAARSNWHARQLEPGAGFIFGDRSILTSYAVRWPAQRTADKRRHLEEVNRREHCIALPTDVLYLEVDEDTALERIRRRPGRSYGQRDEQPARLRAHLHAYRQLREEGSQLGLGDLAWRSIDANR